MPRYCAHYACSKCQAHRMQIETAPNYRAALIALPRWIFPANHRMRREGGPKLYKENP